MQAKLIEINRKTIARIEMYKGRYEAKLKVEEIAKKVESGELDDSAYDEPFYVSPTLKQVDFIGEPPKFLTMSQIKLINDAILEAEKEKVEWTCYEFWV